jgi:CheY-like chemotaxis protein
MLIQRSVVLHGRRILVVEDTPIVAREIAFLLGTFGCKVVGPVSRVPKAIDLLHLLRPDAALLDVNLGAESGCDVADELLLAGIPFIFLTAYDVSEIDPIHRDRPSLQKPFSGRELRLTLEGCFHAPICADTMGRSCSIETPTDPSAARIL